VYEVFFVGALVLTGAAVGFDAEVHEISAVHETVLDNKRSNE
jgi:hypothetical protein